MHPPGSGACRHDAARKLHRTGRRQPDGGLAGQHGFLRRRNQERHPAAALTKYKVLATYKNGSFVQVIAKTNSSWYEVTAPDGKHGYMSTTYLVLDHTEGSASEATSSVVESRQLRDQPFRIYRVVPELDL